MTPIGVPILGSKATGVAAPEDSESEPVRVDCVAPPSLREWMVLLAMSKTLLPPLNRRSAEKALLIELTDD